MMSGINENNEDLIPYRFNDDSEELETDNGNGEPDKKNTHTFKHASLSRWLEISVNDPEKRNLNVKDAHVVYCIETRVTDPAIPKYGDVPTSCWRRYSEFELLRNYLETVYPYIIIPPLPEKRMTFAWQKVSSDKTEVDFIERRRIGLEKFLNRISKHDVLSTDKILFHFLVEDGISWKNRVMSTDFKAKGDSKLMMMSASMRLKSNDSKMEAEKSYCNEMQTHLNNIIRIRSKIAGKEMLIHQLHSEYGRIMSEWCCIEGGGDGFQAAGHYIDAFSQSIEPLLEDEEPIIDRFKEYVGYADSIRNVCRRQELLMLEAEKTEEMLGAKQMQRDNIAQGRQSAFSLSGVKNRIFGGDNHDQREAKLKILEDQIKMAREIVHVTKKDSKSSLDMALDDMDKFHSEKVTDLSQAFLKFAVLQTDKCKKGVSMWQNIKESFCKV